jgi:hypothetical protein
MALVSCVFVLFMDLQHFTFSLFTGIEVERFNNIMMVLKLQCLLLLLLVSAFTKLLEAKGETTPYYDEALATSEPSFSAVPSSSPSAAPSKAPAPKVSQCVWSLCGFFISRSHVVLLFVRPAAYTQTNPESKSTLLMDCLCSFRFPDRTLTALIFILN